MVEILLRAMLMVITVLSVETSIRDLIKHDWACLCLSLFTLAISISVQLITACF